MPVSFDIGAMQIWTLDGIPITIGHFSDVVTESTDGEAEMTYATLRDTNEYTATCTMENSRTFTRTIIRLAYGWRAKGPVRKRALMKLWQKYGMSIEGARS